LYLCRPQDGQALDFMGQRPGGSLRCGVELLVQEPLQLMELAQRRRRLSCGGQEADQVALSFLAEGIDPDTAPRIPEGLLELTGSFEPCQQLAQRLKVAFG